MLLTAVIAILITSLSVYVLIRPLRLNAKTECTNKHESEITSPKSEDEIDSVHTPKEQNNTNKDNMNVQVIDTQPEESAERVVQKTEPKVIDEVAKPLPVKRRVNNYDTLFLRDVLYASDIATYQLNVYPNYKSSNKTITKLLSKIQVLQESVKDQRPTIDNQVMTLKHRRPIELDPVLSRWIKNRALPNISVAPVEICTVSGKEGVVTRQELMSMLSYDNDLAKMFVVHWKNFYESEEELMTDIISHRLKEENYEHLMSCVASHIESDIVLDCKIPL
ncbi:laminin subunit alpha [Acrasis kona]|uniref:Laminin subunit alpha n=1 Tax=Acrasis kona TaxID=1008807 RepID=A0AAW2YXJ9_9EUKA